MIAVLEAPAAPQLTPDDLFNLPDGGKGLELVDGEVKKLDVSFLSSFVAGAIFFALGSHLGSRRLGWVSPEGTSFRCFPDDGVSHANGKRVFSFSFMAGVRLLPRNGPPRSRPSAGDASSAAAVASVTAP